MDFAVDNELDFELFWEAVVNEEGWPDFECGKLVSEGFFCDPEKKFTLLGPDSCCFMYGLDVVDVCLFTVRLSVERDLNVLYPIERQHLFFFNDQIIHIHNTILEIPFHIQRMSQLILNNSI